MKKIIVIDRDGTIIREPDDEQVDSLEKLEFVPGRGFLAGAEQDAQDT